MRFDSNSAWREATASVAANRDVLAALAGVFFLLPGLVSVIVFGDAQAELLENLQRKDGAGKLLAEMSGTMIAFGLISFVLQSLGYLALLALLTDRSRPTVAEALRLAVRALPTVVGAALLFFVGYMAAVTVLVAVAGGLAQAGGPGAVLGLGAIAVIVGVVYAMVKFSLILPVVIVERCFNPVQALARSWRLTKGNSLRLFGFYLLLAIVYFVIVMVTTMIAMALAVTIAGQGKLSLFIGGVVSGVVGAAASVLLIAILAAVHRQLAGPSPESVSRTFD